MPRSHPIARPVVWLTPPTRRSLKKRMTPPATSQAIRDVVASVRTSTPLAEP
jgi:hypothetical protein